jgi:hypothetical protein
VSDWRGYVILAIGIAVPVVLLSLRRERELLGWVCLTVGVNVLDARVGLNLPAARTVGLLVLPYVALGKFRIGSLLETTPFRLLALQIAYLLLMGIVYGVLFPWPDEGFIRGTFQTTQGRLIVYLSRCLADLGLVLFTARQVMNGLRPSELLRLLLLGITVAAVGGLLEYVTRVQLYQVLTGFPIEGVASRVRGLNFEPRGLGLTMAHGVFFGLLARTVARERMPWWLLGVYAFVLALTASVSAVLAATAMLVAMAVFESRMRGPAVFAVIAAAVGTLAMLLWGGVLAGTWGLGLAQRFSVSAIANALAESPFQALILVLDIFDLTALLALQAHPLAAIFGAGPGLITVPGSHFIPENDPRWLWVGSHGEGITSLPSTGLLLEWANGGIPGLILWLALVATIVRALGRAAVPGRPDAQEWRLARGFILCAAAAYLAQASPIAASWPVVVGFGLGAVWVTRRGEGGVPQPAGVRGEIALGPREAPA